jgi:hypothetical protein
MSLASVKNGKYPHLVPDVVAYELQWRNVISGPPRFKIFEGPPSRSAIGTSWATYMHEFSRGSRACSSGKFLNLHSPFPGLWGEILQKTDGQKTTL